MEYITIQKVHYNAIQYSSVHYNTVQYNAVHYNTVHRNIYVVYYSIVCPSINYCPHIIHSFYKNIRHRHSDRQTLTARQALRQKDRHSDRQTGTYS